MITDQRIAQISKVNSLKAQGHVDSAVQHVSELLVELERFQRENAEVRGLATDGARLNESLREEIEELEAKLAAAEADTKRRDWLNDYPWREYDDDRIGALVRGWYAEGKGHPNLRAAIDAAKTEVKA